MSVCVREMDQEETLQGSAVLMEPRMESCISAFAGMVFVFRSALSTLN